LKYDPTWHGSQKTGEKKTTTQQQQKKLGKIEVKV